MAFHPDAALRLLTQSHREGRLAHAYLITGPAGSGKADLAAKLINLVNFTDARSLDDIEDSHVHIVRPEMKSRRISVDTMRELERRIYMAAPKSLTKVGVVVDADRMNPQASNAFLKTLEEPPVRSLILLLTAAPEQLLDTILSRCIRIPLIFTGEVERTPNELALLQALSTHFSAKQRGLSAAFSLMQAFAEVLKNEKDAIGKSHDASFKEENAMYGKTTDGEWLRRREEYFDALTTSDYLQRRGVLTQILIDWYGDALRQARGTSHLDLPAYREQTRKTAGLFTEKELVKRVEALEELRADQNTNVNETLALECAFVAAYS